MPAVTDFACRNQHGFPVLCDPFGNNVAFRCEGCGAPVLAVLHDPNQRGASGDNPSRCRACGSTYWLHVDEQFRMLTLHRVMWQD